MSKFIIRSIKFNFMMNFVLTASSFIFSLITFPYVSRILLPEGNGKLAFATSIISYFLMIAQLGIPVYGLRVCAKIRDDKEELSRTVQELLIINVITTVITYVLLIILLLIFSKFQQYKTLLLINSITLVLNIFGMNWLYSALEQYSYITIRSLVFKIISIIAMFMFVHEKNDYIIYAVISVFGAGGSNVMNFINARKFIYIRPVRHYNIKRHIKPILVFFALNVATSIYLNLDTIMLGFMKSDNEVGLYNAAVKIKIVLNSLVGSLGAVLLPRMSYYIKANMKKEFMDTVTKAMNFVILLSVPLSIYFVIYAKESILLLSGVSYLGSVPAMIIIIPSIIFIAITNILGMQILVPINKERYVLISVIVGAIIDILVNAILIPKMGSAGAALGTLIAEFTVLIIQILCLRKLVFNIFKKINFKYVIISSCVSTSLVIILKTIQIDSVFISLLISGSVFFGSYGIVLLIQREPLISNIISEYIKKCSLRRKHEGTFFER